MAVMVEMFGKVCEGVREFLEVLEVSGFFFRHVKAVSTLKQFQLYYLYLSD